MATTDQILDPRNNDRTSEAVFIHTRHGRRKLKEIHTRTKCDPAASDIKSAHDTVLHALDCGCVIQDPKEYGGGCEKCDWDGCAKCTRRCASCNVPLCGRHAWKPLGAERYYCSRHVGIGAVAGLIGRKRAPEETSGLRPIEPPPHWTYSYPRADTPSQSIRQARNGHRT